MMDRMGKPTPKTRLIDISNGTPTSTYVIQKQLLFLYCQHLE
jgi:hypothetical protein